jgi:hypothetical protein
LAYASPGAWQHVSCYGRYEFTTGVSLIGIDAMVSTAARRPVQGVEEGA